MSSKRFASPLFGFICGALALVVAGGCSKAPSEGSDSAKASGPIEIRFAHAHSPDVAGELHFTAAAFTEALPTFSDRLTAKIFAQATLGSFANAQSAVSC